MLCTGTLEKKLPFNKLCYDWSISESEFNNIVNVNGIFDLTEIRILRSIKIYDSNTNSYTSMLCVWCQLTQFQSTIYHNLCQHAKQYKQ